MPLTIAVGMNVETLETAVLHTGSMLNMRGGKRLIMIFLRQQMPLSVSYNARISFSNSCPPIANTLFGTKKGGGGKDDRGVDVIGEYPLMFSRYFKIYG